MKKKKRKSINFIKHFNWKLVHEESCLYIWVLARAKFAGAVSWQALRATEVRRRELQGPLIWVVNCFSLVKRGQTQFLRRSTALAVLAASRMNACGNLTNGCFYPPTTTTSAWNPKDTGSPYLLELLSLLYLIHLNSDGDSKIFVV